MEIGKYYVDGEGFYKCVGKEENCINKYVRMDMVTLRLNSIGVYTGVLLVEPACDKRMVECTKEQYEFAKDKVIQITQELYDYNTEVFTPLWETARR